MFPSNTKSIGRDYLTILGASGPDAATLAGRASSRNCLAARPLGRRRSHADPWRNTGRIISSTDGATKKSGPLPHLARARPFQVAHRPTNIGQVLWAMATRSRPARSIDIRARPHAGELCVTPK